MTIRMSDGIAVSLLKEKYIETEIRGRQFGSEWWGVGSFSQERIFIVKNLRNVKLFFSNAIWLDYLFSSGGQKSIFPYFLCSRVNIIYFRFLPRERYLFTETASPSESRIEI